MTNTQIMYSAELIGKKESVVDEILLLNPNQTPLINLLGFSKPTTNTIHAWYEDEVFRTKAKVIAAATETASELKVDDVEAFTVDSIAQIDEELVLISSINHSMKTLTVERGYSDTTAAAIAKDTVIEFLFTRSAEGMAAREARSKPRTRGDNYTQIFMESVSVTGTAQAVDQYGIRDLYDHERVKKQLEVALQLEKALINGIKYDDGRVRQMSGIRQFIKTNLTDAGGQKVSIQMLRDMAQTVYKSGGLASGGQYVFIVSSNQKVAISDLQGDKIRIVQAETVRGQVVDKLATDFGTFSIVMNDNVKDNEILLVDPARIAIRPLKGREFGHVETAITGDTKDGFVVGEYTLEFLQEKAHARIKNLG
ncbi:SU10 major capsid protein [Lysinibacillus fusiformis]|uniref:SU10 major capsid protein n=1 Tax=Lysinibacillus fusiformis TaxID=28031 RepID=UPI0036E89424